MRTLLLDGDIYAYQVACSCETEIDWGDDVITKSADLEGAKKSLTKRINSVAMLLAADRVIVCLSDSQNFRKELLPSYKSNRKGVIKPALLSELRKYLHESQEVFQRPFLEADDVMGILSTMGDTKLIKGERIIVSIDKDMKSIPGLLFNPNRPAEGVIEISVQQADLEHMRQTLTGDTSDGYQGCPGVGKAKVDRCLEKTREDQTLWDLVVTQFEKSGLTEADALAQAQVARICRAGDYDFLNKKPIPWFPPQSRMEAA